MPMSTPRRRFVMGMASAMLAGTVVAAPVAAQDAGALINSIANRVLVLLKSGVSDTDRENTLSRILHESFDLAGIGRSVMGRHWTAATPDQRARFIAAFEKAEVRAYSNRFKEYSGQSLVVGKVTNQGSRELVDSRIVQPNGTAIRLVWEVVNGKIMDVSIEGVSMAITRRSDFNAYIQRNGIDGLIGELERRSR